MREIWCYYPSISLDGVHIDVFNANIFAVVRADSPYSVIVVNQGAEDAIGYWFRSLNHFNFVIAA